MRYLALDWGERRIGVAVGDDVTGICSPVEVVQSGHAGERLRMVLRLIEEHGPGELVLGLPLNMDGSEGPTAHRVRAWGEELSRATGLRVRVQDERLSSYAADEAMSRSGLTHQGKKQRRDALAAAAILRSFLERSREL